MATTNTTWRRRSRLLNRIPAGLALLAVTAYVPLLLTSPGEVGADTKTYLYLDPGRLLSRAAYMWDTNIGFGTITHQNIGYLWPMGPYYWLMQTLGVPDWIAQRLWLGSILFLAGLGRPLHVEGTALGRPRAHRRRVRLRLLSPTCSTTAPASRSSCCPSPGCPG